MSDIPFENEEILAKRFEQMKVLFQNRGCLSASATDTAPAAGPHRRARKSRLAVLLGKGAQGEHGKQTTSDRTASLQAHDKTHTAPPENPKSNHSLTHAKLKLRTLSAKL